MSISDKTKGLIKKNKAIVGSMSSSILNFAIFKVLIPLILIFTLYKITPGIAWYPGMPLDDWLLGLGYGGDSQQTGAICWSCGIFTTFSDVFFYMGNYFQEFIIDLARAFLFIATTIWILYSKVFKIFKGIVFDQGSLDAKSFYESIIGQMIRVILVLSALTVVRSADVMKYVVLPIMEVGTGTSSIMMNSDMCSKMTDLKNINYSKGGNQVYIDEVNKEMFCFISSFDAMMLSGVSAGKTMVRTSTFLTPGWFMGMIFCVVMFFLYITIPFQLIDIIFDIGLILIFLPFMILGYAYDFFKKFHSVALPQIKSIAMKLIIFSISISILYLSLFKMADYYFPKPADNFSVIFPNYFVFKGDENGANFKGNSDAEREAISFFKSCLGDSDVQQLQVGETRYSDSQISSCHKKYLSYKKLDSAGYMDLLPIIFLTMISLMIFGSFESYISALGGSSIGVMSVGSELKRITMASYDKVVGATKTSRTKIAKAWKNKN